MLTNTSVVAPLTANCARLLVAPTHLCLGVSPFHGYFTTARIAALASWALSTGARVDFFLPDRPAVHTMLALGYPRDRAVWKARRQGQYLHNKIRTALRSIGADDAAAGVLDWHRLHTNPVYRRLLADVHRSYRHDAGLRDACRHASAWVLSGLMPARHPPGEEQVRHAVRYLLAELPLLADTAAVVGTACSLFCYQQAPTFVRDLYEGVLALRPAYRQGFLVVEAA